MIEDDNLMEQARSALISRLTDELTDCREKNLWLVNERLRLEQELASLRKEFANDVVMLREQAIAGALAESELIRLKRGDFTNEEFQNLCHNRHEKEGCTAKDFFDGCAAYQKNLFGRSERDQLVAEKDLALESEQVMAKNAAKSRLDGLRYALGVVKGRRILNRPPAYLAALDEMEIFLEAAIDRVERGEQMSAVAIVQTKTPPE